MVFRLVALVALSIFAAFGSVTAVGAVDTKPAPAVAATAESLYPDDILHPVDLDTFYFELTRSHTGSAAKRQNDFYMNEWDADFPGLVGPRANNAPFLIEWQGEYENPGRFAQGLRVNNSQKIYEEWFDGDDGRIRFADGGLQFASGRDSEALVWWDRFADWLEKNGDAVSCGTATRLVNDEQSVRCNAPNLTLAARVALVDAAGLSGATVQATINRLDFELWLTRDDYVPVRLSIAVNGVDANGDAFGGSFLLDIMDIDDDDIYVDLPRQ